MNIYVGNLAHATTEPELRTSFEKFGEVSKVNIIMDKADGKSKGFGFVEMPTLEHAQAAITGMHGKDLGGRTLEVNQAKGKPAATAEPVQGKNN